MKGARGVASVTRSSPCSVTVSSVNSLVSDALAPPVTLSMYSVLSVSPCFRNVPLSR